MQCTRCQHVFMVTETGAPAPDACVSCPRCGTTFRFAADLAAPGRDLECSRCHHVFPWLALPVRPSEYTGSWADLDVPRRSTMLFAVRPGAEPPPGHGVQPASPDEGQVRGLGSPLPAPASRPPPAAPPTLQTDVERLVMHAAENQHDAQVMQLTSERLREEDDPRGELIALMLEEEQAPDEVRSRTIEALIREHSPAWTPPGARITAFHRGLPSSLEWTDVTDPQHLTWRLARALHVTVTEVPTSSVFDVVRPLLERVTGLERTLMRHVLEMAPPGLQHIEGSVFTDDLLAEVGRGFARMRKLRVATLRSTSQRFDPELQAAHLGAFFQAARRLEQVRLSLPRLAIGELDRCLALAPRLSVHFLVPFEDRQQRVHTLAVDPRWRQLIVPMEVELGELGDLPGELSASLGTELSVVQLEAPAD